MHNWLASFLFIHSFFLFLKFFFHDNINISPFFFFVLDRVLLLWLDTMTKATFIRTTFNCDFLTKSKFHLLSSRWEHGSIQGRMVLEDPRVPQLQLKGGKRRLPSRLLAWGSWSWRPQWHTYYNRATPSNSTIPWTNHIQTITTF